MALELTSDGYLPIERELQLNEVFEYHNTDVVFIPVQYIYDRLIFHQKLTDEMLNTLEASDKWSDQIFLEIIYDLVMKRNKSGLLKYDIIICSIRRHQIGGLYTYMSWLNNAAKHDTIKFRILNNKDELWTEYHFPPRSRIGGEVTLINSWEGESWADTCVKMLDGVSIRNLIRNAEKKYKSGKMGSEIRKLMSLDSLSLDDERVDRLDDLEIEDISL